MEKKKFLFDSLRGLIGDIAWQVSKEGHEVRYHIKEKKEANIADGIVAKSEDPEKDAEWADIIIFDDTLGQGEKAQARVLAVKKWLGHGL
jgi:phosphoribosylamine--glycine ligase